ncbi:hypothetical protein R50073_19160 [Maricurvus nonylphenolicus]|uniref:helix-turn-helix transcriptional regulator n=1 Tax=Maricurvus nonylphenolicus TaxID=1008307 RepID=UPI0036F3DF58
MYEAQQRPVAFKDSQSINLKRYGNELSREHTQKPHFHDLCEIIVFEAVNGEIFYEGKPMPVRAGQMLFLPPETIHSMVAQPGKTIVHILHFEANSVVRIHPDFHLPGKALLSDIDTQDMRCVLDLLNWCGELEDDKPTAKTKALETVLSIYFEQLQGQLPEITQSAKNKGQIFIGLEKYLNEHNKFQCSVEEAAEQCHLSRSHFMSKFKRAYGMTFNRFMVQRKVNAAKYLLRSSELSITEIAHRLEMDNASYFTKIFKAEVGCTPKAYTRLHTEDLL